MLWRLNRIQYPLYNHGKGKRIGITVQGCTLACPDCISKDTHSKTGGKQISVELLVDEISKIAQFYDGVTIVGGEPFQQYEQLIAFCAYLKQKTGLEIYVFSGYTLNELFNLYPDKLFLQFIDYLMDGRYVKEKHDNQNVRGSSNQKLYKFENGEAILQTSYFQSDKFSVSVDDDKQVYLCGIPKNNELTKIADYLNKLGIDIQFE